MPLANSVNRNKVAHTYEVVYSLVHWLDDEVFRQYPTWDDCLRARIFSRPQLETFFGPNTGGGGGYANYAQCVERGVGRRVIIKMLAGAETLLGCSRAARAGDPGGVSPPLAGDRGIDAVGD